MTWHPGKFPFVVILLQLALIVVYAFFVAYDVEADASNPRYSKSIKDGGQDPQGNSIKDYYPMFQDVDVMIFIGFGFLMTFLKKYGYGAVGFNMLLAALSIQWAIIMQGVWNMEHGKIKISIVNLINGNFASATVLISYGALLGKVSHLQLVVMAIIEITIFACNEHLGLEIYKASDIGGSMFLHTFGAYFGLTVSAVLYRKDFLKSNKEGATYQSDIFAMIGTVFLWMFWPSFNSALAVGDEQHRSVINTYCSLLACCVVTFGMSSLVDPEGRLNMVHIQNATLAGGVAIGSVANMMVHPYGAMIIGALAGFLSTLGYRVLTPILVKNLKIHDTCGVNNLHGMPGIMSGLLSAIIASVANETDYGLTLYEVYPGRSPLANSTKFHSLHSRLDRFNPGDGWTAEMQALTQIKALFTTLAVAIGGGLVTGYIIRWPIFDPPKPLQLYDDSDFWEVPEDEG